VESSVSFLALMFFFSAPEYYHLKLPVILLNVKTDQAMLPVGDSALHSI
jgi:hypothetical protein